MLALVAFPFLAVYTAWLLSRWTSLRALPVYVLIPLYLSFFTSLSVVVLVPFDLVGDSTLDNGARLLLWRCIYWISFFLMWAVLPILQAFVESGYDTFWLRLRDALHATLKYHLLLLAACVAGAVYMFLTAGVSFTGLKAVGVALSHSYGLVLVIYLLGHGLVDVPRAVWQGADDYLTLEKVYMRAVSVHDGFADAKSSYDQVVAQIMALEVVKTSKYASWLDGLVAEIREQQFPLSSLNAPAAQPRDLTAANLASLSARFKRELGRTTRAQAEWTNLLNEAKRLQNVRRSPMRLYGKRALAVLLAALSAVVAYSEMAANTRASLVDVILRLAQRATPVVEVLCAAGVLAFMCACVNWSLTSLKVFNLYAIVPRHTDASSLLFFAAYALRLTVPLTYNFLMLSKVNENTVFQQFLGHFINLTPLSKYFNLVIPRLVFLPMLLTAFNVYELVKDYFGFGLGLDYLDDAEANVETFATAEGRELVRRELDRMPQEPVQEQREGLLSRFTSLFSR